MESKYPAIQQYIAAWKSGDGDAVNRITLEVTARGDDSELMDLSHAMAATPFGSGQ